MMSITDLNYFVVLTRPGLLFLLGLVCCSYSVRFVVLTRPGLLFLLGPVSLGFALCSNNGTQVVSPYSEEQVLSQGI
jgi:hypothetical protein